MRIKKFPFKSSSLSDIKHMDTAAIKYGTNWPVVYILNNESKAYVGETLSAYKRTKQHLDNPQRKGFEDISIILDEEFNKSAILDIEAFLIKYMSADRKLDNLNDGLYNYDYYEKAKYVAKFEPLWNILKSRGLVKGRLIDIECSDFFAYSPYKVLTLDQMMAVEEIIAGLKEAIKNNESITFIVNGSAGTGKTVLATYLMKLLKTPSEVRFGEEEADIEIDFDYFKTIDGLKTAMVVPQQSLRKTISKVFSKVSNLKSSDVIKPYDVPKQKYDLLIVDEAHRLQRPIDLGQKYNAYHQHIKKMGLDDNSTELDWIMKQSKYQILFFDEDQSVRPTDIRSSSFYDVLKDRKVKVIPLRTQMRVNADEDYVGYIKRIFYNQNVSKEEFSNYEFKLYDSFSKMRKDIIKRNNENEGNGYARIVAGYAWNWISKNDETEKLYDIQIENEKMRWNHTYIDWINSPNSINEVGCIHTVQGYDLNYCGVIIGPEIDYDFENNRIVIDKSKYKDVAGKKHLDNDKELLQYIINIYTVLLTRGIKGTYVYVCNENMKKYLKKYINN